MFHEINHHLMRGFFILRILFFMFEMNDLPSPQQRYKDDRGTLVTIISIEERRVVFMRDGYPYLCMRPMYNFLRKFKKLREKDSNEITN